MMLRQSGEESG